MTREWRLEQVATMRERVILNPNGRAHWHTKATATANVRQRVAALCRAARIPRLDYAEIELHLAPPTRAKRDAVNLCLVLKASEDGVRDAGVIDDDTPQHIRPLMPVIDVCDRNNPATGTTYLIIREAVRDPEVA